MDKPRVLITVVSEGGAGRGKKRVVDQFTAEASVYCGYSPFDRGEPCHVCIEAVAPGRGKRYYIQLSEAVMSVAVAKIGAVLAMRGRSLKVVDALSSGG